MSMIRRLVPESVRERLRQRLQSPVLWANFGVMRWVASKVVRPLSRPVLVLSLPRSGSSWVGRVLGLSGDALYLNEPLTDALDRAGPSFFEVSPGAVPPCYQAAADAAFAAIPLFSRTVVVDPAQWSLARRRYSRLLIKEVNPLAGKWLIESYLPRVIYLLRHPAAVASSFARLGWTGEQFERRFTRTRLQALSLDYTQFTSFWAAHGAIQAVALLLMGQALGSSVDHKIVLYEDLCLQPVQEYRGLYEFAGLTWNDHVEECVVSMSESNHINRQRDAYGVRRNSSRMVDIWREELTQDQVEQVKRGYLHYDPPYYGVDSWRRSDQD